MPEKSGRCGFTAKPPQSGVCNPGTREAARRPAGPLSFPVSQPGRPLSLLHTKTVALPEHNQGPKVTWGRKQQGKQKNRLRLNGGGAGWG